MTGIGFGLRGLRFFSSIKRGDFFPPSLWWKLKFSTVLCVQELRLPEKCRYNECSDSNRASCQHSKTVNVLAEQARASFRNHVYIVVDNIYILL